MEVGPQDYPSAPGLCVALCCAHIPVGTKRPLFTVASFQGGLKVASSPRQSSRSDESSEPHLGQGGASFRLKTLGDAALLRVLPGEEVVKVLGPGKPLALVAYLTCSAGRTATREHLIDFLWSNLDLDGARQGLRQTLWYLRRRLGPDAVVTRDQEVVLTACVDSDRDRFLEAMDRRDFERAIELYQGEFMPMFAAPGGADFEAWGDMERFRLRTYFLGAAEAVAWKRMEQGNLEGAKAAALRARDIHPLAQSAWRLLLEILLAANDPLTARIEGEAMAELVAATSLHQPVALFVDDVHWADDRSQELLHTLSERVPGHRLLLVTTARTTGGEAPKSCTGLVSLEPLSADNVKTLLASLVSRHT